MRGSIPTQHQAFRWAIVIVLGIVLVLSVISGVQALVAELPTG